MDVFRNPLESLERDAAQIERMANTATDYKRVLHFERDANSSSAKSMFVDFVTDDYIVHSCGSVEEVVSELLARKGQANGFDVLVWSIGPGVEEDMKSL
ncbi:MAG: hypothetical protein V4692_14890, partial [Bdellovibrionota bacterium]